MARSFLHTSESPRAAISPSRCGAMHRSHRRAILSCEHRAPPRPSMPGHHRNGAEVVIWIRIPVVIWHYDTLVTQCDLLSSGKRPRSLHRSRGSYRRLATCTILAPVLQPAQSSRLPCHPLANRALDFMDASRDCLMYYTVHRRGLNLGLLVTDVCRAVLSRSPHLCSSPSSLIIPPFCFAPSHENSLLTFSALYSVSTTGVFVWLLALVLWTYLCWLACSYSGFSRAPGWLLSLVSCLTTTVASLTC